MTTESDGALFDAEPPDDTPDPGRSPSVGDDGWTWEDTRRALGFEPTAKRGRP